MARCAALGQEGTLSNASNQWSLLFATVPLAAVTAALIIHLAVFRLTGTPLPLDRTGLYIVVLLTLFLVGLAAVPIPTRAGDLSRRGLAVLMVVLGLYFLLCLRMTYFKEWKWDSDSDKIYSVLASYNHTCGLKDVIVNRRYDGVGARELSSISAALPISGWRSSLRDVRA